jgi:hypothetical protein
MELGEALERVAESVPETTATFQRRLAPEWIQQALAATGTATLRRRRLPAEQVVWLVLGMAIMRDRRIDEVVAKLDLALPAPGRASVAPSSIPQARSRLGVDPMNWLFERTGKVWAAEGADANRWRGLAIYGVDGTSLRVADSVENRGTFGGQNAGADKGDSGYPLLRVVAPMSLRTHVLAGAAIGGYATTDEQSLTTELMDQIPDASLTIFDRNFLSPLTLVALSRAGDNRHWLTRTKSNTAYKVTEHLADGSELVEMKVSSYAREADPTLGKT